MRFPGALSFISGTLVSTRVHVSKPAHLNLNTQAMTPAYLKSLRGVHLTCNALKWVRIIWDWAPVIAASVSETGVGQPVLWEDTPKPWGILGCKLLSSPTSKKKPQPTTTHTRTHTHTHTFPVNTHRESYQPFFFLFFFPRAHCYSCNPRCPHTRAANPSILEHLIMIT